MNYDLSKLSLKEKIGQMIGLAFAGSEYSPELAMQIENIEAGLIIYFKIIVLIQNKYLNLIRKSILRLKLRHLSHLIKQVEW